MDESQCRDLLKEAAQEFHAAEAHLEHAIIEARRAGISWSGIAMYLGTTKQAAQQRYGKLLHV